MTRLACACDLKRLAWSAFVAFWTAVLTLLAVGALAPQAESAAVPQAPARPAPGPVVVQPPLPPAPEPAALPEAVTAAAAVQRRIALDEVARHAAPADCWMAIRGKVYDFTAYIARHPTRPEVMTRWCGREATQAYDTKGIGRRHSRRADARMVDYELGVLATAGDGDR